MILQRQLQRFRTYYSDTIFCYRILLYLVPPVFLQTIVALLSALLSVPTIAVLSWAVEHTFFSTTTFGWEAFGELALPLGACFCAAVVFLSRNPMHALLSLLGVFFSTTLMYLLSGIAFVGLVFLIVYVGAVAVLFLFVIMLLNVKSLTSRDALICHPSQVAAIIMAALLLQQTHQHIVSSTEQTVSDSFVRDASVEPTTGDAVFFYVRFIAADINALTGLYTVHAILFLITTAILLGALLGAIILATVTTERATSISDIRAYSPKHALQSVTLLSSTILLFVANGDFMAFLDYYTDDFSIPTSLYAYRITDDVPRKLNQRHKRMRRSRRLITDGRYRLVDPQIQPGHFLIRGAASLQQQTAYKKFLRKITAGTSGVSIIRVLCRRPRLFRLHAAAALASVQRKLLRRYDVGVIVRRRWLWHWRRDRALSLLRLDRALLAINLEDHLKDELIGLDPRKDKEPERDARVESYKEWRLPGISLKYPAKAGDLVTRIRFYFYEKWLISQRRIRLRWAPLKYLRFRLVTHYMPPVLFWAWRLRAFCVLFIFYFFVIAIFSAVVYAFIEDHPIVGSDIADVYRGIHKSWYMTSEPTSRQHFFAGLLVLPAALLVWTVKFAPYILIISVIFAYDTVMMHAGQMSNLEFHEARCNYWRVEGWREVDLVLDEQRVVARLRSKEHPDKGRVDIIYPHWIMETVHNKPDWFANIIFKMYDAITFVKTNFAAAVSYIQQTQAYRCLTAYVKNLLLSIPEKFPFLTECWREAARLFAAGWVLVEGWLWDPFVRNFYNYTWYPRWLRWVFCWIDHSGGTIIAYSFFTAGLLYGLSCLVLCIQWRRMYYHVRIKRTSVFWAIFVIFFWLSFLAIIWDDLRPIHIIGIKLDGFSLIHAYYRGWSQWIKFALYFLYWFNALWMTLAILYLYEQIQFSPMDEPRREFERHEPVTLRAYVNRYIRLRGMFSPTTEIIALKKQRPKVSAVKAYARASARDIAHDYEEYRKEQAKLLHFNIVMHTYVPTFYDNHTHKLFQKFRWPGVWISGTHHKNAFYD